MRHFSDWLSAYADYARDGFCPDKFHFWTGVSLIAGALERRVWVNQSGRLTFPNLYIFLVAHPGEGKSSASDIGVNGFLRNLRRGEQGVSFLPDQLGDAAFVESISKWTKFVAYGKEQLQSSHFLYISEASNSLKDLKGAGEITAALTNFYDCPSFWKKMTISRGPTEVRNACCNLLVGCTFSYLNQLFPDSEIMGGFASRVTYIVHNDKTPRVVKWETKTRDHAKGEKIFEDLSRIFNLSGQFTVTPEYAHAFEDWFQGFDAHRRSLTSERMQAFLARKHTNILKLSMVLAVSEGDNLTLTKKHWDLALGMLDELEQDLPHIMHAAAKADSFSGINKLIIMECAKSNRTIGEIHNLFVRKGIAPREGAEALATLKEGGILSLEVIDGLAQYRLRVDANNYL